MDSPREAESIKIYVPRELFENENKEYGKCLFVGWKSRKNQIFIVNAYEESKAERLASVLDSINRGCKLRNLTYMKNGLELIDEFKIVKKSHDNKRLHLSLCTKTGDRIKNVIVFIYNNESFDFKSTNLFKNLNIGDEVLKGKSILRLKTSESSQLNSDVGSCSIVCTTLKNYIDNQVYGAGNKLEDQTSLSYMNIYDRNNHLKSLCAYYAYQFFMKITLYLSTTAYHLLNLLKHANKFVKFMEKRSNFVSLIMNKLRTISLWHKSYEELFNKTEIGEYLTLRNELKDVAVSFYLDLFLGVAYMTWFRGIFMEKLFVLRSCLKTQYIERLKSLFYISTVKVFIHIKLNNEVSTSLSKFVINKVILWNYVSVYLRPVRVFLFEIMHYTSIFGLSALVAYILDVFTVETTHLYCLYFVILALMNYCHKYLYSLIQLFKGKKWNILKSELDTNQFTKEHLFIGVVFFIVFTLNYPTIWIFYISIIMILIPVLVTKALIQSFIEVVYEFPYYFIVHNTFGSLKFTQGVYFKHMYKSSEKADDSGAIDVSSNLKINFQYLHLEVIPNMISLSDRNERIKRKVGESLDKVSPIKLIRYKNSKINKHYMQEDTQV